MDGWIDRETREREREGSRLVRWYMNIREETMVSDHDIAKGVESLLRHSDPNSVTTVNGVVQQLEVKLGLDLSHKAGFIRDQIDLLLRSHPPPFLLPHPQHSRDHYTPQPQPHFPTIHFPSHFALHPHPPSSHHEINFQQPLPNNAHAFPQTAPPPEIPKQNVPTGGKRKGGAGGLNKVCGVSPELQAVVGESALPRTEIVRQLWAYIRKNNLQDPGNKRKIICDDALRSLFETDCTDMFKMNKLLAKHIIPLGPSKESQAKRAKVEAESTFQMAERVNVETESTFKLTEQVKVDAESAFQMAEREKVEAESAFQKTEQVKLEAESTFQMNERVNVEAESTFQVAQPASSTVIISEALAKFLASGRREMQQSEVTRLVWEYIKLNHLEDPSNSMMISCDAKLQELLGCESISALGISEMLQRHHLFKQSDTSSW